MGSLVKFVASKAANLRKEPLFLDTPRDFALLVGAEELIGFL